MPKIKNLFLNHVYNMLDEHTYNAINNSDFLKEEFCNIQEQSKHNDKMFLDWCLFNRRKHLF